MSDGRRASSGAHDLGGPPLTSNSVDGAAGASPDSRAESSQRADDRREASPATLDINVVTIFPAFFAGPLSLSIPARAAAAGAVRYRLVDLRDFTHDRHRSVDDYPYGGGPGMVMRPGPFFEAVESLAAEPPIVLLSPRGRRFGHADAVRFAEGRSLTLLCGHYKDVDQRVAEHLATEELSLGDFVLSGGEPAALAIIDAVVRLLPGAMSDLDSARSDSFWDRGLSAPSYTRPPDFRGHAVPEVLLSGDHARIAAWRAARGAELTLARVNAERAAAGLAPLEPEPAPPTRTRRRRSRSSDGGPDA